MNLEKQSFSNFPLGNRKKILEMVERDFLTIGNLEASMQFMLKSYKGRGYQYKILHSAFKRCCDILLKRRKFIAKELGLKFTILREP